MKCCTKCDTVKSLDLFGSAPSKKSGKHSWCKACLSILYGEYRRRNRDKVNVARRIRYRESPQRYADAAKIWRLRNPDKERKIAQRQRIRHPDSIARAKKACAEKKPDLYRELRRLASQRRRAKIVASPGGGVTTRKWAARVDEFNSCCAYCNEPTIKPVMEHMDPLIRGGAHDIDNVVPSCRSCNSRKHTQTVLEFLTGFRLDRKEG